MYTCDTMAVGGCWCEEVVGLSPVSPGNARATETSLAESSTFHVALGFYSGAASSQPTSPTTSSPATSGGKLSSRKSLLSAALLRSSIEKSASQSSRLCTVAAKTTPAGIFDDYEGCDSNNLRRNLSAPLFVLDQLSSSPPINIPTTT